jgi:hypothetical protein
MIPNKTALDGIFTRIEANHGLAMRSNFLCCQSCGHAALEADHLQYGFYHVQDMEHAVQDGKLYLAFSTEGEDDVQTAETIVEALREEGCTVEWDGTARKRIVVDVEGPTFDLYAPENIPKDATGVPGERGTTIYVWKNPNPTREVEAWEVRIVGDDGFVWHADAHETHQEALRLAHGIVPSLDIDDDEEEITDEEE